MINDLDIDVESQLTISKFEPRWYQIPIIKALEQGYRRLIWTAPRRSGKDITAFNMAVWQALKKRCLIFYALPSYRMAKSAIYEAISSSGVRFMDYVPKNYIESVSSSEMKIRFINGSILNLISSENYDRQIVGTNAYALIFSEAALIDVETIWEHTRQILAANGGWALFVSTPSWQKFVLAHG